MCLFLFGWRPAAERFSLPADLAGSRPGGEADKGAGKRKRGKDAAGGAGGSEGELPARRIPEAAWGLPWHAGPHMHALQLTLHWLALACLHACFLLLLLQSLPRSGGGSGRARPGLPAPRLTQGARRRRMQLQGAMGRLLCRCCGGSTTMSSTAGGALAAGLRPLLAASPAACPLLPAPCCLPPAACPLLLVAWPLLPSASLLLASTACLHCLPADSATRSLCPQ